IPLAKYDYLQKNALLLNLTISSVVCAVKAIDGDTDMNAQLHYSLYGQTSDLFSIDPNSGTVFTSNSLKTEDIIINVHVEDGGENPKFDTTTISIRFQNISDFPEMTVDVLSYSLFEDQPVGTVVAVISAASIRAEPISFYLASGNFEDMFHVDQLGGALTVHNSLDYESKREFSLLIEARDSGWPPFSSFLEIQINITDVNDNPPQFTQAEYRYGNTNSSFSIDPLSGIVLVNSPLDRELWPTYNLTVTATDNGSPPATGTTNVIVTIVDINDNENQPEGTIVAKLHAFDFDLPPNQGPFIFWLLNLSAESAFFLTQDGVLLTSRVLDREHITDYRLQVVVKDTGFPIPLSSTTTLHVMVEDENDNAPLPRNIFIEVKYFGINDFTLVNFLQFIFLSGVSGIHCEELSYGFEEMSFIEFPPLDSRANLIYFEFATVQKDSLLLYNSGTSTSREFLALEILGGTIQLSYDLGSGPVRLQTFKQVADGLFHSVTVRRIGNVSLNYLHKIDQSYIITF
uniref:Uncharacterized protein n=1 Tax=Cyprinodon variegatus TaxID=28743 RepID=A0A3Q2FU13_CYPVA